MKKCYADKSLQVSKGEFERPANLSIKVDCYARPVIVKDTTQTEQNTDEFEL
jgi:penicillin-binding protein 1A